MGNRELLEIVTVPDVPRKAFRVFEFLRENENLVTVAGGMDHFVTGLNRAALFPLARNEYGINLRKYRFAVNWYEQGMLTRQKNNRV